MLSQHAAIYDFLTNTNKVIVVDTLIPVLIPSCQWNPN
jgi:hypothetical protein